MASTDEFVQLVQRVLSSLDVRPTANITAQVIEDAAFHDSQLARQPWGQNLAPVRFVHVEVPLQHGLFSIDLAPSGTDEELAAHLASELQGHLMEFSESPGTAIPPCPGHPHPMRADVVNGRAMWTCPAGHASTDWPILAAPGRE